MLQPQFESDNYREQGSRSGKNNDYDAAPLNKIGGLDDCLDDLAAELKMSPGEYEILEYPGPKSLREVLGGFAGGYLAAPDIGSKIAEQAGGQVLFGAVKELVGPKQWPQVRDQLSALMQLRKKPIVLTSPRAILVK